MANILIRNIPDWLHEKLTAVAKDNGLSVSKMVAQALADKYGPAPGQDATVLGFVRFAFYGDVNPEDGCDQCGTPYQDGGGACLVIRGDGVISGVWCATCAGDWHN